MLRPLKRSLAAAACFAGLHHLARRRRRADLLILCYHGVTPRRPRPGFAPLFVTRADFEQQLRYVRRHYRILPIDAAIAELWAGGLREPTACITFDDGYRNNRTEALPVLERLGVPATVYLATGMIGTNRRLWTTQLADRGVPREEIDRLKRLSPRARDAVIAAIERQAPVWQAEDDDTLAMMDWADVRAMEASGLVSFGGHTANHEILSTLDEREREVEIAGCLDTLRSSVANPSSTFAYPNGQPEDFDAAGVEALRRAGITAGLSTIEGFTDRSADHFALRRIPVSGDLSFSQFRVLTAGLVAAIKRRPQPRGVTGQLGYCR